MAITAINNLQMIAPPYGYGKEQSCDPPDVSNTNKKTAGDIDTAVDHRELEKTIVNINKMLESMDTSLQFYVHKDSGRIVVKVINNKSKEVIREIPPEEILKLDAKIKETAGLIIDKKI